MLALRLRAEITGGVLTSTTVTGTLFLAGAPSSPTVAVSWRARRSVSLTRASVSLSYVTIAFNVARPFCLMDVAEF